MTPRLNLDADGLARHRLRLGRDARSLRPRPLTLDDNGTRLAVMLPGPDYVAALLALPRPAYRDGATLLLGEEVLGLGVLADGLRETLAALPDRDDAGEPYLDLRLAARSSSTLFEGYLLDVVRAYRRTLPRPPAVARPKAAPGPSTALSPTERKRAQRARERLAEAASSLWWLDAFLDDEDDPAEVGSTVLASDLYNRASDALLDFEGEPIDEDDVDSPLFVVPRRRVFLTVATHRLGAPRRTKHGSTYTVPEEHMSPTTRAIIDRAARILADEARAEIEALTAAFHDAARADEEAAA